MSALPLAIASGDPSGVGPETILNWARTLEGTRDDYMFFGPEYWIEELRQLGFPGRGLGYADFEAKPGYPDRAGALIARDALMKVAAGCRQGMWSGAVTGPVSKAQLQSTGFDFPGQTEYFAEQWGGRPVMGFVGQRLKVILATWHIPLHEVSHQLTPSHIIRSVKQADFLARAYGVDAPRIGVCGLNPHAGEGGVLGHEEEEWINPLLEDLRPDHPELSSCQAADSLFWRALQGEFDVIVALYHDQGLIPMKTLEFDRAVNVTLGLPHVRTSPDHGTGFSIAGKGIASHTSFGEAIKVAQRLIEFRKAHPELVWD